MIIKRKNDKYDIVNILFLNNQTTFSKISPYYKRKLNKIYQYKFIKYKFIIFIYLLLSFQHLCLFVFIFIKLEYI